MSNAAINNQTTDNPQKRPDGSQAPSAAVVPGIAQPTNQVPALILGQWPSSVLRRRSAREVVMMPTHSVMDPNDPAGKKKVYADHPKGTRISSGLYGALAGLTILQAFRSVWTACRLVGDVTITIVPGPGMAGAGAEFGLALTGAPHLQALPTGLAAMWTSGLGGVKMAQAKLMAPGAPPVVDPVILQRTESAADLLWPPVQNSLMSDPRLVIFTMFHTAEDIPGDNQVRMFAVGIEFTVIADPSTL